MIRANATRVSIEGNAPVVLAEFSQIVGSIMSGLKKLELPEDKIKSLIDTAYSDGMADYYAAQQDEHINVKAEMSDAELRKALHAFVDSLIDGKDEE